MKRLVQAVILLLFGVALVKLAISDSLQLYVRPAARPWVGLAGLAMIGLAGWGLLSGLDEHDAESDDADLGDDGDHGDGHDHGSATSVMWLILAPVVAVLVIAPPALGTFTADRAPSVRAAAAAAGRNVALAASGRPEVMSMFDFLVLSSAKPAALRQQPVLLTGFVLATRPGSFTLARLVITCCAADASTAAVLVTFTGAAPNRGAWVQVTGTFTRSEANAAQTPVLAATSVTATGQPTNPYDH